MRSFGILELTQKNAMPLPFAVFAPPPPPDTLTVILRTLYSLFTNLNQFESRNRNHRIMKETGPRGAGLIQNDPSTLSGLDESADTALSYNPRH